MDIVNISYAGPGFSEQSYSQSDSNLIASNYVYSQFGQPNDYIELFVYDTVGNLVDKNYNLSKYYPSSNVDAQSQTYSSIQLDPQSDLADLYITRGTVTAQYNFLRNLFNSSYGTFYWIKEISNSRTELKLSSQNLSNATILGGFNAYKSYVASKNYYSDFYLNFGNNQLVIAVNVAYTEDAEGSHLLIKLYEPLPTNFSVKDTLWIVEQVAESVSYNVDIQVEADVPPYEFQLRGPNFKIPVAQSIGQTTGYYNYDTLITSEMSSSYRQLKSYYQDKSIRINVDYSNFSNFVKFSNVTERIKNFVYKLGLIESYEAQIGQQSNITSGSTVTTSSINLLQSYITNIVENFDGYEYYLYYASESYAWPKSTSTKPYQLYSVTSSQAIAWLGNENTLPSSTGVSILYSASLYDTNNFDALRYTVPQYILDDENNLPYITFLDMTGQHFDNIWLYYKDVTNRYNATNNPSTGVSLDVVADALKGLGIQLYTNTSVSDNLYYTIFGINPDGSLLPPTGSEVINTYVTSSLGTVSANDLQKEFYKRIYHNLPYLLKSKGTQRSIKALISSYGIPESILSVNEFGGYQSGSGLGLVEENNQKVVIGSASQQLFYSQLSKDVTIEKYDDTYRPNSPNIEVAFSPSNTINSEISASLGYFNIDQLVGNPSAQYSGSYPDLVALRDQYFAQYTKPHSVWEYIRLVKYYNNSLFKMIRDFVPAKADLSTGVVIKSHVLERNKYARHEPSFDNESTLPQQEVSMLSITGSDAAQLKYATNYVETVSTVLGPVSINNSYSWEKFTGRFSGSVINADLGYFPQTEQSYNPYDTHIKTPITVQLNALRNNVSQSVKSHRFLDLDYSYNQSVPVNYDLVKKAIQEGAAAYTDPYIPFAQVQDYNYSKISSVNSRYNGAKLSGLVYNYYSTASTTYAGDIAYGHNPVVERHSNQVGFFTQLQTSSFLPGRVNATLAYFADVSGGLSELNQNNKRWEDVQNTFVAGKTLTVKLFDNQKYGNQKPTDGVKLIYNSGYSYTPQLYFLSGSDNKVYFEYVGSANAASGFTAVNSLSPNAYISGSTSPYYLPNSSGYITNIFDELVSGGGYYVGTGSTSYVNTISNTFPTYEAQIAAVEQFSVNLPINVAFHDPNNTVTYNFDVKKNGTSILPTGAVQASFTSTQAAPTNAVIVAVLTNTAVLNTSDGKDYYISYYQINPPTSSYQRVDGPVTITINTRSISSMSTYGGIAYLSIPSTETYYSTVTLSSGQYIYISEYDTAGVITPLIASSTSFPQTTYNVGAPSTVYGISGADSPSTLNLFSGLTVGNNVFFPVPFQPSQPGYTTLSAQLDISATSAQTPIAAGDQVTFELKQTLSGITLNNFTASLAQGSLKAVPVTSAQGAYPYATSSNNPVGGGWFIDSIADSASTNYVGSEIVFDSDISRYYQYQQVPYFVSQSVAIQSSLYSQYGDVSNPLDPQFGDKVVVSDFAGITQELDVINAFVSGSKLRVDVVPQINSDWKNNPGLIYQFLMLKRYKDEQNVILTFKKTPGATSYGFVIPEDVNKTIIDNINTLQAAVQSQLLSTQANQAIDTITGGTFG